ncbi:MAG: DUF2442 domain-containing protein [Magnetococcales bacterium]|nr:DUF2442 domain-containing protein [Magnetococcales bacterium]
MLIDVIHVEVRENYQLLIEFDNREQRLFDMSPYLNRGVFRSLKDSGLFHAAHVEGGTVVWPGEVDIAPETLYVESVPVPNA